MPEALTYVLDIDGNPLMPTRRCGKVRRQGCNRFILSGIKQPHLTKGPGNVFESGRLRHLLYLSDRQPAAKSVLGKESLVSGIGSLYSRIRRKTEAAGKIRTLKNKTKGRFKMYFSA